MDYPIKIIQNR